ncbi:MAG: hypothetical protein ACFFEV_00315, partial [Candidatus Thorarchaeota archaeon]
LSHRSSVCPIVNQTGNYHTACWVIRVEEEKQIPNLFYKPMTGKEIFGLLSSGTIEQELITYSVKILLEYEKGSRESYVYHEDNWIRRLLRDNDIILKRLPPGTFLRDDEQWVVDYVIQDNNVEWTGISNLSGLRWMNKSFRFSLNPTLNYRSAKEVFLERITDVISQDIIYNYSELESKVEILLLNRGYGEQGPQCVLSISRRGNEFTIILTEDCVPQSHVISKNSFIIERTASRVEIVEGIYNEFDSGEFSKYNIVNVEEFMKNLEELLNEIGLEDL